MIDRGHALPITRQAMALGISRSSVYYLHAYDSVAEARSSIGRYLSFYNGRRPHSSLDRRTPDQAYFNPPTPTLAVA